LTSRITRACGSGDHLVDDSGDTVVLKHAMFRTTLKLRKLYLKIHMGSNRLASKIALFSMPQSNTTTLQNFQA
jgi:hypothetical protein